MLQDKKNICILIETKYYQKKDDDGVENTWPIEAERLGLESLLCHSMYGCEQVSHLNLFQTMQDGSDIIYSSMAVVRIRNRHPITDSCYC